MSTSWLAATGLALPLLVAAAVALLYLLRPPPRAVVVPALLLWRRIAARRRKHERFRRLLSALLSLAVAAAVAFALAGKPRLPRRGEAQLLVIDDSATMAAEAVPGTSRLELARRRARELVDEWRGPTLLADTTGRHAPWWARSPGEAEAWLGELSPSTARARLPAVAGAGGAATGTGVGDLARRILVTDGVALEQPAGWQVESVYSPAVNVGWTAFAAEAPDGGSAGSAEVYLEVLNASPGAVDTRLVVEDDAGLALVDRQLRLEPRETWSGVLDLPSRAVRGGSNLHGRLETAGDALAGDDRAVTAVAVRHPVVIATVGVTGELERALGLLPGVTLLPLTSSAIADGTAPGAAGSGVDLLVASGWAPSGPPAIPSLLVAPPRADWLPEPVETLPAARGWVRDSQQRDWGPLDLSAVQRYEVESAADDSEGAEMAKGPILLAARLAPVEAGASGETTEIPLVFEAASPESPTLVAALSLAEGPLTRHESFPVFVAALVARLSADAAAHSKSVDSDDAGESHQPTAVPLARRLTDVNATRLGADALAPTPGRSTAVPERGGASSPRRFAVAALFAAFVLALLETWSRARGITE